MMNQIITHAEILHVEETLGNGLVICERCGCTLDTYAEKCSAGFATPCDGFLLIEAIRKEVVVH